MAKPKNPIPWGYAARHGRCALASLLMGLRGPEDVREAMLCEIRARAPERVYEAVRAHFCSNGTTITRAANASGTSTTEVNKWLERIADELAAEKKISNSGAIPRMSCYNDK